MPKMNFPSLVSVPDLYSAVIVVEMLVNSVIAWDIPSVSSCMELNRGTIEGYEGLLMGIPKY